jgi:hypothetical protein
MDRKVFNAADEIVCKMLLGDLLSGCGWRGKLSECDKEWYSNVGEHLAFWGEQKGWVYMCPKCGIVLKLEFK